MSRSSSGGSSRRREDASPKTVCGTNFVRISCGDETPTSINAGSGDMPSNPDNVRRKRRLNALTYRTLLQRKIKPEPLTDRNEDVNEGHSSGNLKGEDEAPKSCSQIISEGMSVESIENRESNQSASLEVSHSLSPQGDCDHLSTPPAEVDNQRIHNNLSGNLSAESEITSVVHEGICDLNHELECDEEIAANVPKKGDPVQMFDKTSAEASNELEGIWHIFPCKICRQKAHPILSGNSDLDSFASEEVGDENGPLKVLDASNGIRYTVHDICVICERPGLLLHCNGQGCSRRYHLSCLDMPPSEFPSGRWYCHCCSEKMKLTPLSFSEEIESIIDARVVCSSDSSGQKKEFLVKYRGLSHVHNKWVSEKELLNKASHLLEEFKRRNRTEKAKLWNTEWTIPERLLKRKLILPPAIADESCSDRFATPCDHVWLVKWTGLGYEHATWESDKSLCLNSPKGIALIKSFESRQNEARKSFISPETDELRQSAVMSKLPLLPEGSLSGQVDDYLHTLNQLRENWLKGRSLVLLDEQEKMAKVILFILSTETDVTSPFLILSSGESIPLWESEFKRLAPSINVIAYRGSKDGRKIIRDIEFYREDGSLMFQVIISLPELILEDYDSLSLFRWEALIVDDCHNFRVSKHLDQLNKLPSDFRLILVDGQLQDNIGVYLSLLSFLDSRGDQCFENDGTDNENCRMSDLAYAKERLSHFTICNRKARQSKYLEFWVPVELSTVQLEQNCSTLVSHSLMLRSPAKTDRVGTLSSIVIAQRKCCDHPYLVDDFLQATLTENLSATENLDVGVQASGKLKLLDRILQEMRDRRQRAVVLFQVPGRDGKCCIGDILDDFLRQRFGEDSYERLDSGVSASKKLTCLNMFNIKEKGRFVFLTETRACSSTVRLTAVDAVIIFSSDWNPTNDLRALNRMRLESSAWPIKIFRLYSVFSLEEKALILAKQDSALDSNIQNFNSAVSRSLLSWGASYAFSKLDEFHGNEMRKIGPVSSFKTPILDEVIKELQIVLSPDDAEICTVRFSKISKCEHTGPHYSKDVLLLGEKESAGSTEEQPSHVFWSRILEGRSPKWKFVSLRSPWARRKPCFDSFAGKDSSDDENGESSKRRKKMMKINVPKKDEASRLQPVPGSLRRGSGRSKEGNSNVQQNQSSSGFEVVASQRGSISLTSPGSVPARTIETALVEPGEKTMACLPQKDTHLSVKRNLEQLCETLQLSPSISEMAKMLLTYVLENHRITLEPAIMQALIISLCWRAASTLEHKLDHRTSLLLAKKTLKFQCTEEETESVYQKVRTLRKKSQIVEDFRRKMGHEPESREEDGKNLGHDLKTEQLEEGEIPPLECETAVPETHPSRPDSRLTLARDESLLRLRIKLFEKVCSKRADKLRRKHELEIEKLNSFWESQGAKLKKALEVEQDLIISIGLPCEIVQERSDFAEQKFQNRMRKFETHMKNQLKRLISLQAEAKNREQNLTESWLAEVKAGKNPELFEDIPLEDTCFSIEEFETLDRPGNLIDPRNARHVSSLQPACATLPRIPASSNPPETSTAAATELTEERNLQPSETVETNPLSIHNDYVASPCADATQSNAECLALSPPCGSQQAKESNDVSGRSTILADDGAKAGISVPPQISEPSPQIQAALPGGNDITLSQLSSKQVADGSPCQSRDNVFESQIAQQSLPATAIQSQPVFDREEGNFAAAAVASQAEDRKPIVTACLSAPPPQPGHGPSSGPLVNSRQGIAAISAGAAVVTPLFGSVPLPSVASRPSTSSAHSAAKAAAAGAPLGLPSQSSVARLAPPASSPPDPLLNELMKIQRQGEKDAELHDMKKKRLFSDREQELDAVRRKYEALFSEADNLHAEGKKVQAIMYAKVQLHWALAQDMRSRFVDGSASAAGAQGTAQSFNFIQQLAQQASLPRHGQRHGGFAAGHLRAPLATAMARGDAHQRGGAASPAPPPGPAPTANLFLPRLPPGFLLAPQPGPAHRPVLPPAAEALHPLYDGWPPSLS
ncbi:uncharacterized protein LOC144711802 isoform X2 [Wolffia australiana]